MEGEDRAQALERLSATLRVLGAANRLDLLQKLLVPRTVAEIDLRADREDGDKSADRPIARQSIEHHLERLQEVGLVTARAAKRERRSVTEWQTNAGRLFLVADELRRLSASPPSTTATTAVGEGATTAALDPLPPGPTLLLANGPWEGRAWTLAAEGRWTIGRERGNDVALTYDPFVSRQHAVVHLAKGRWTLEVLSDRAQTTLNWRACPHGARVDLVPGDTVGLGRSLLVVRGA